jgi:hypothetical protein
MRSFRACPRARFSGVSSGMCPGSLARPRRGLGPQPLDLTPWQGDTDLADPFQLHSVDRLGVEAREVDDAGGFPALDGLQVALARLQPDRGLFPVEARNRMALLPENHDNIAVFVLRQHGIAGHLKGDGFLGNRERQFDIAEPFRRHLLVFRLDVRAGADPAHDRHRVQFQVIDDRRDFRCLDQPGVGQDLGNRAGPDAHRRRQTALGLTRLRQSPLDHPDIQHGPIFSEFQK